MKPHPASLSVTISGAVKAVLIALVATGVLPWDETTTATVALAVAAIVDTLVILGILKPRMGDMRPARQR